MKEPEVSNIEEIKEVAEKVVEKLEKTRTLTPTLSLILKIAAIAIGIYEILFIFNFMFSLYDLFSKIGIKIPFFRLDFQDKQGQAFVLGMILIVAFLLYPMFKKRKHLDKIPIYDWIILGLGVLSMGYMFFRYPVYMIYYEVNSWDIIFGIIAILVVLEATRRSLGWILPAIVFLFLLYGIQDTGFRWSRIVQYLYLDQGIFGIPFFVMTIYVFSFVFFGAFLLRIGISDYVTEFMISLFGSRSGGPAKAAVVSSGLMGTVSGSSVANVLTTGTFTIPLMKRAGYPAETAGAVEPVASTGGQLMPPIMGAAAFIMAQFLNIPYNRIIIAAILPAIIYYAGVYLFIDLETKRLGLKGLSKDHFTPVSYFIRKLYILLPILIITIALVWGIAPHIAAVSSLGIAIWVAWISRDEIPGNEQFYVIIVLITLFFMFGGMGFAKIAALMLLILGLSMIAMGFAGKWVKFNEKLYISLLFIFFVALTKYVGVTKESILLMSGVFGIIFSLIVGISSKTEEGKKMYAATYQSMIDAGKTSSTVMLAAASAGLIQGVLTMTGLVTSLGYKLIDLTGGNLLLLLFMAMIFSLILGMGVPTTANYVITSLVAAPAVFNAVTDSPIYNQPVLGYGAPVALLAAHFFVFYFGILADLTPPVALASYAGSALAGGEFWKTAQNSVKYALAGYIGPYIYFTHPDMFLITVNTWNVFTVIRILYYLVATVLVMYLFGISLTGWFGRQLNMIIRIGLVVLGFVSATLNLIPVLISVGILVGMKFFFRNKDIALQG